METDMQRTIKCPACKGRGKKWLGGPCSCCGGTKTVLDPPDFMSSYDRWLREEAKTTFAKEPRTEFSVGCATISFCVAFILLAAIIAMR